MREAILAAAIAVASCGAGVTPAAQLKESVDDYTRSMRWGHVERAAVHVPDAMRSAFIRQKRLAQAQIQIHEYDVRAVEYTQGSDKARVIIVAAWSRPSDPVVHQQMIAQEWRYRERRWELARQYEVQPGPAGTDAVEPRDAL